jgi:hypothetical protein
MMAAKNGAPQMAADQMIWVQLNDGNFGQHPIIGMATKTKYGYRSSGEKFMMASSDVAIMQHRFIVVPDPNAKPAEVVEPEPETPEPQPAFVTWQPGKAKRGRRVKA